jgi:hypothetical protein
MSPVARMPILTPATLERIGRALYGDQWLSPLSRALGYSNRRPMRELLDGSQPIHAGVVRNLLIIVEERQAELEEIIVELSEQIAPLVADLPKQ